MSKIIEVPITAEVIDKDEFIMRVFVGDAKSSSGESYEMAIHAGQSFPIIKLPTGEVVSFGWQELLNAADIAIRNVEGENA